MVRLSVMYPNQADGHFDLDYYREKHMALVKESLSAHGLIKTGVDQGLSDGGKKDAPFICTGYLYFESKAQFDAAMIAAGAVLRDDIANFTNVTPQRQLTEILDQ